MAAINKAVQRRNSQKSSYRTIGGSRDQGQRFVVRYRDGMGTRRVYGYTESRDIADQWCEVINSNPLWDSPRVADRRKGIV